MNALIELIDSHIRQQKLLSPGESLVVAVSGGLDSMALMHLLSELAPIHRWRLSVAHLNHRLRGRRSDTDEAFVRRHAQRLGLPFFAGQADVREAARRQGVSIEMAARQLRHQFLARAAHKARAGKIALAHHADDQVELFFLRLLRGSGPEGLTGMKEISPSPAAKRLQLIRPLLVAQRQQLETFVAERHLLYRQDASNEQLDFARNRIRHQLLPLIRKRFQPALTKLVLRVMDLLRAETELMGHLASAGAPVLANPIPSETCFEQMHLALQRRSLRDQCLQLGIDPDFQLIEALRHEADRKCMVAPDQVVFRDAAGKLHLSKPQRAVLRHLDEHAIPFAGARGRARLPEGSVSWRIVRWNGRRAVPKRPPGGPELFDADKVGPAVSVRHWRAGDRFQPIGLAKAVKLQDLFTNAKVPQQQRHELLLATTTTGEVFWVEGLRVSERHKLDPSSRRCLEWHWQRTEPPCDP